MKETANDFFEIKYRIHPHAGLVTCKMDLRIPFKMVINTGTIEQGYAQPTHISSVFSKLTEPKKNRVLKPKSIMNYKKPVQKFDIIETYLYFKGMSMKRRIRFDFDEHIYRAILTTQGALIIFRDLLPDRDDTDALVEIAKDPRLNPFVRLEVNYDAKNASHRLKCDTYIITAGDFYADQV